MGLRGVVPSPNAAALRNQAPGVQRRQGRLDWPEPPAEWAPGIAVAWTTFYESDLSRFVEDVDVPVLIRLFSYYDLWVRTMDHWRAALARDDTAILGETGGKEPAITVAPEMIQLQRLEQVMKELENRFGVSPIQRARLGIKIGAAIETAERLNDPERQRRGG